MRLRIGFALALRKVPIVYLLDVLEKSVRLWFSQSRNLGRLHELGERIRQNLVAVAVARSVLVAQCRTR